MADYDYDIGIIGGGAAGLTVASGAAQLGARTLLVEKERELGGDCLHYGCVPSKTLIKTAHVYHQLQQAEKFGLPPVSPGPVDFRQVAARIKQVIGVIQKHDSVERFCRLGAKVEFGEPRFTDEHSIDLNGKAVTARSWLVATGTSPAIPPLAGLDKVPYLTNREIFSLDKLPESMIILGAGPIAIEMAQAFARLGSQITVLQRSGQILSKEDRDMADEVMTVLQAEGVTFHLGCNMLRADDLGGEKQVTIETAAGDTVKLVAAEILVALGRAVNVDGLGLDQAGVDFDRKGIKVDGRLRTSQKHIYGAGDVIGGYQFTHAAGYEGGIVVSNAVFHLPRKVDYTWMPWCTYTGPELASIGMNEKMAQKAGIEYRVWTENFRDNDRSLAEGEEVGKIKLLVGVKGKPIGVQILGPRAGDLLGEWIAVLNGGLKLSGLAGSIHPYPTLTEINKRVTGAVFTEKIFSDTVKKGLKFLFNFKGRACNPDSWEKP
ncbi:MAG: FAD-dependent oxidoreductase [Proteobacteria bacterium]|nr:FAD-dependent oxidoreductase [Pseudomonadota bacterium]MBU1736672.1 FAD-dependent oxidoreductase [Pseudomonadota bacterium]